MKKALIVFICCLLIFSLWSCSGKQEEPAEKIPPAFTVLQNQMKMTKHWEKGSNASFSKQEFVDFFGEEFEYITINTLPESGNLICNGKEVLKGQTIQASEIDYLKYVPKGDNAYGTFGFNPDNLKIQKDIICEIVFKNGENSPPLASNGITHTAEGISCGGKLSVTEPNGDSYKVNIITYPKDGFLEVDQTGNFVYTPKDGFSGKDLLVYSITDCFGSVSSTATHEIMVNENPSSVVFKDLSENPNHIYAYRMCDKNIMVYRYENGEYYFDPQTPVSKMDFLVMLMCVSGMDKDITAVADSVVDDDTGLSSGLKGYLSAAYEKGLLNLNNGRFAPKENITAKDAAFMISAALKLPGAVDAMSSEKADALIKIAVTSGIFDAQAKEDNVLTKADTAKLLCRIEDYITDNNIQKD